MKPAYLIIGYLGLLASWIMIFKLMMPTTDSFSRIILCGGNIVHASFVESFGIFSGLVYKGWRV